MDNHRTYHFPFYRISVYLPQRRPTEHTELYDIDDALVADTPGFSSLEFNEVSVDDIKKSFVEFKMYPCIYKDCTHTKEEECVVRKMVKEGKILESRYNNYLSFIGSDVNEG